MHGSLFISYSHTDSLSMQVFRKHLNGILMDDCRIWTDEEIPAGTTWEKELTANAKQAAAGLVLVSPDYLISPWCRRELKLLADARERNELASVYWVLLKPCGWKWTKLADLQAVQETPDQALLSLPESEREWHVLRCCETIAAGLKALLKKENEVVAAIRAILLRSNHGTSIKVLSELSKGDFSIVGRGMNADGEEVVIKVLTNTPLRRLRELFYKASGARKSISLPEVVQTIHLFKDSHDERIVIVSERARGEPLSKVMEEDARASTRHLTIDTVGVLLRRIAEALKELHKLKPIRWKGGRHGKYDHLMGPLLPSHIYYERQTQRPQISLVSVTNFLWRFFDPETFWSIVAPKEGIYRLPEKHPGEIDQRADQYFLGMLALELLEGKRLFNQAEGRRLSPADALAVAKNARWARRHEQLSAIVSKLLAEKPEDRFSDMEKVIASLDALEDSTRALAKYSFLTYIAPGSQGDPSGAGFAKSFYDNLFTKDEVKRVFLDAGAQEFPNKALYDKLINGLKAVLNFRPGCTPSSIDSVAKQHVGFKLNGQHFAAFKESFIETLEQEITRSDPTEEISEITNAWKNLFDPVRDEMLAYAKRHPLPPDAKAATHGG